MRGSNGSTITTKPSSYVATSVQKSATSWIGVNSSRSVTSSVRSSECKREYAQRRGFASLATVSCAEGIAGFPSGSVVGFAALDDGTPIFCFSAMSAHAKNLLADSRASLTVTEPGFEGAADARAVFTGRVVPLSR